ncbi:hypothetical protein ACP70R_030848 [Stipagrostis hirtigluma subsp. patula]
MGPLKSGCFVSPSGTAPAPPPPPSFATPPSPPSKTPPLPPPPPPPPPHHFPLPPPPPLPPGFTPSSRPPLLPPCSRLRTPPRLGTPPQPSAAPRLTPSSYSSGGSRTVGGGRRSVEHPGGVGVPTAVPGEEEHVLAGVVPELLPLKKRVVRHHPYAAAWAIQEMAASRAGGFRDGDGGLPRDQRGDEGLRAELLRLRIPRPALVLTKRLTLTDRSRDKARLLLPDGLVNPSPLLSMLTPAERRLVFGRGLPVPAFDRDGRPYRMSLRRDPSSRSYRLTGHWSLFLSRHRDVRAVEVRAFRPPAWQARLERHGEGGLGMALLHCPCRDADQGWSTRERDAADGLLLIAAAATARRGHCTSMQQPALESAELVASQASPVTVM